MLIKVLNLDKCIKKFGDIGKVDIMPEIKESTRKVQKTAKEIVPVDTSYLRNSIKTKLYKEQQSGIVYTTTEYAPFVEFGTSKMQAQPFMTPALNIHRAGIQQSLKKYLREQFKKGTK